MRSLTHCQRSRSAWARTLERSRGHHRFSALSCFKYPNRTSDSARPHLVIESGRPWATSAARAASGKPSLGLPSATVVRRRRQRHSHGIDVLDLHSVPFALISGSPSRPDLFQLRSTRTGLWPGPSFQTERKAIDVRERCFLWICPGRETRGCDMVTPLRRPAPMLSRPGPARGPPVRVSTNPLSSVVASHTELSSRSRWARVLEGRHHAGCWFFHRLSTTLALADRVALLDCGTIVAHRHSHTLIKSNELYPRRFSHRLLRTSAKDLSA